MTLLCGKAWRESRGRFAIGGLVIGGGCAGLIVLHTVFRARLAAATGAPIASFADHVHGRIFVGVVRALFGIIAILLGLGGLHQERRTLGFSLALPVRRVHHVAARAAVGMLEVTALAALLIVLVPPCAAVVGEHVAVREAAEFAVRWLALGAVMFTASLAVSSVVRNDYAALAVAMVGLRLAPRALAGVPILGPWLAQPAPAISGLLISALVFAAGLIALAAWRTERERFF